MGMFRLTEFVDRYNSFDVVRFQSVDTLRRVGVRVSKDTRLKLSVTFYATFDRPGIYEDSEWPDGLHELAIAAIAYHALTGDVVGFPVVEIDM